MTLEVTHSFVSAVADGADDTVVQPSDWNDDHVLTMATGALLGRVTPGTGAVEELTPSLARSLLSLVIGTDVQAYDADLTTLGGLSKSDGNFIVGDGSTWVVESGATARASLGLTIGTHVQAYDAELAAIAGLVSAADKVPYFTGSGTAALADFTAYGRSIAAVASEAAFKALVNLEIGTDVQAYSTVLANTTASFLTAQETKLGHITVTQAVDLDAIETRVNALDASVILMGTWDASAGTFPGGGTAQAGASYIVSVSGTVDGVAFVANDRILAITDNASTSTYAANWHKLDYTDAVLSVAGKTGAVTLQVADITDMSANGRSLVSAADYAAMKALLDLEIGTDVQAYDADLATLGGLAKTDGNFIVADGSAWTVESGSTARASLGLTIGTHVQAWDAQLDEWATVDPSTDGKSLVSAADYAAMRTLLGVREQLTGARNYYVRTDGNDSNTGLANTSGGAFLTIPRAISVIYGTIDTGGNSVTINVASGTYTAGVTITGLMVGGGTLTIAGSTAVISTTSASCVVVASGGAVTLTGLDLRTTTGGNCLWAQSGGSITCGVDMIFGACAGNHVQSDTGCSVVLGSAYTINGGAVVHWSGSQGRIQCLGVTITLTGTPAFSLLFAYVEYGACLLVFSNTFSGSATGTRYFAAKNGVIDTNGGGATYLPGDAAGSTVSGGQYI